MGNKFSIEDFHKLVSGIAGELGGTFTKNPNMEDWHSNFYALITISGTGADISYTFSISYSDYLGKLSVSDCFPRHKTKTGDRATVQRDFLRASSEYLADISLSYGRPVKDLARDIRRRYLSRYPDIYALALAWISENDDYINRCVANSVLADKLAKGSDTSLSVSHVGGDRIGFVVSVTPANAEKLAKFVASLRK